MRKLSSTTHGLEIQFGQLRKAVRVDKALDVAFALLFQDFVDSDENAGFFDVAKRVVDGGAKHAHRGRKTHVGAHQRRDVEAALAHGAVENLVVGAEIVFDEELSQLFFGRFEQYRIGHRDEAVAVAEMTLEKIEYHVARLTVEARIHGHFPEEVFQIGDHHREGTQAVPKIVERVETLGEIVGALVLEGDERAAELYGLREKILDEIIGEMKHVAGGQVGLSVGAERDVGSRQEAIAAQDFAGIGIPHHQLIVGFLARVEFVEVKGFSGTAAAGTKGDFAQTTDFAHHVRGIVVRDDVDLVAGLVGLAELTFGGELLQQEVARYRGDDFFHCREFMRGLHAPTGRWSLKYQGEWDGVRSIGEPIDQFAHVGCPGDGTTCRRELLPRNGLSDDNAEMAAAMAIEFVHEVEHGEIEADAEPLAPCGQPIEPIGIATLEINGHNVAMRFHTLRDKGFGPRDVLDFSVDATRTETGGEHDDVLVAGESGTDALREFTPFAAGLVDGHDERCDSGKVHQEVVGQIAHALVVMPAEDGTKHHTVGAAEGVIGDEGETAAVGI